MHVKTRAALHHHIHRLLLPETALTASPGGGLPRMSLFYALEAAVNGSTGPRATLSHGLSRTKPQRRRSRQPQGFSFLNGGGRPPWTLSHKSSALYRSPTKISDAMPAA